MSSLQKDESDWPSWVCPKCFKVYYILPSGITKVTCGVTHTNNECCHYGESPVINKFNR